MEPLPRHTPTLLAPRPPLDIGKGPSAENARSVEATHTPAGALPLAPGASPGVVSHAWASLGSEPSSGEHIKRSAGERQGSDARQRGGAPFLVPEGTLEPTQSVASAPSASPWSMRSDPCPLAGFVAVDPESGWSPWQATCNSARCQRCSRVVSGRTFALARSALTDLPKGDRVRFITLTLAPED